MALMSEASVVSHSYRPLFTCPRVVVCSEAALQMACNVYVCIGIYVRSVYSAFVLTHTYNTYIHVHTQEINARSSGSATMYLPLHTQHLLLW